MFKQQLTNKKKVIITAIALLIALVVGIMIFATSDTKETGSKDYDNKTEQGKEDSDSKEDEEDRNSQLEILESDEVEPEDSSNASGSWGNASNANTQAGNSDTTAQTDKVDDKKSSEGNKDEVKVPQKEQEQEQEQEQDILEDDVSWGNIY